MSAERYGNTKIGKIKAAYDDLRSAVRAGDNEGAQSALDRYEQWADFAFAPRADLTPPAADYVAGLGLKRIVEEIDGAMKHGTWRDEHGMRLKDTPEWVAFYNSLAARPASPDTRVVDWQQLEAVAHALSVADAKCDPEVIHKLEAQARAIIGGQDRG